MFLWVLALLAIAAAFAGGVYLGLDAPPWLRRLRARLYREPFRTRYPVVLVHGVMGFDQVNVGGAKHEYFRGVQRHLEALGVEAHRVKLPPVASVASRAAELARFIRTLDAEKVNIIAHSMGGLDARYAIAQLGLGDRVASLVTVATPHHGTPLADAGTKWMDRLAVRALGTAVGLQVDAFHDLTIARMTRTNAEIPDASGVFYGCVVARAPTEVHPLLRPTHGYLSARGGESDGLVPVDSQVWGEVLLDVRSDHWGVVGWGVSETDAPRLFADVVRQLVARGH